MKLLMITLLSLLLMTPYESKNVYICKGPSSKKYHYTKKCRGLSNCSKEVSEVTLEQAKKIGRTLCGWED